MTSITDIHFNKHLKESMGYLISPCIVDGCYQPAVDRGRCIEHPREAFVRNDRASRLPKDWNHRRELVMRRDKGICYLCGEPGADTVDHVNQSMEDDHSLSNLAAVHDVVEPHCHRYKTAQEGVRARQMNQPMKNRPENFQGFYEP